MTLKETILWSLGFAAVLLFIHFTASSDQCDPVDKACRDATYAVFANEKTGAFP